MSTRSIWRNFLLGMGIAIATAGCVAAQINPEPLPSADAEVESGWSAHLQHTLEGHSIGRMAWLRALSFSADGMQLISAGIEGERPEANGSYNGSIKVWNPQTGELIREIADTFDESATIAIGDDRQTLISRAQDGTIELRDLATGTLKTTLPDRVMAEALLLSQDGQRLVTATYEQQLTVWDVAEGRSQRSFSADHAGSITAIGLSSDGQTLATSGLEKTIKLWNLNTGELLQTLPAEQPFPVLELTFSPDGQTLASGSNDGSIRLWDLSSGTVRQTLNGHEFTAISLVFSPNGQTLASGDVMNRIQIWDVATGEPIQQLTNSPVREGGSEVSLSFSPDGRQLAGATYEGEIQVWELR